MGNHTSTLSMPRFSCLALLTCALLATHSQEVTDERPLKGRLLAVARARLFSRAGTAAGTTGVLDPQVLLALHPASRARLSEHGWDMASLPRAPAAILEQVVDDAQRIVRANRVDGGAVADVAGYPGGGGAYLGGEVIPPLYYIAVLITHDRYWQQQQQQQQQSEQGSQVESLSETAQFEALLSSSMNELLHAYLQTVIVHSAHTSAHVLGEAWRLLEDDPVSAFLHNATQSCLSHMAIGAHADCTKTLIESLGVLESPQVVDATNQALWAANASDVFLRLILNCSSEIGNHRLSVQACDRLHHRLDVLPPSVVFSCGVAYEQTGNRSEALLQYEQCGQNHVPALHRLAMMAAEGDDNDKALALFESIYEREGRAALLAGASDLISGETLDALRSILDIKRMACNFEGWETYVNDVGLLLKSRMLKKHCDHPFMLVVYSICHPLTAEQLLSVAAQRATCTSNSVASICQKLQAAEAEQRVVLTDAQVRLCRFRLLHPQTVVVKHGATSSRRLKVAYVSEHFHNQATSFLWQGMFRLHNYRKYDVQCFSVAQEAMDHASQLRTRMIRECGKFVDLDGQGMLQAALEINTEGIHIALGTVVNFDILDRNDVFALMPAPLNVNFVAHPGTSGGEFMHYMMTDHVVSPPEHAVDYSEQLMLMPHHYVMNDHWQILRSEMNARLPPDARVFHEERRAGHPVDVHGGGVPPVVFCNFNRLIKSDPLVLDVWSNILRRTPNALLWLLKFPATTEAGLSVERSSRGLHPSRLHFSAIRPIQKHLRVSQQCHLFMDTLNYNAHTTAMDALFAGVPLLTVKGSSHASRPSMSAVSAAGLGNMVARSLKEYEDMAADLVSASRQHALRDVRRHGDAGDSFGSKGMGKFTTAGPMKALRQRLSHEVESPPPLFDTPGYVAALENRLQTMWDAHSAGTKHPLHVS